MCHAICILYPLVHIRAGKPSTHIHKYEMRLNFRSFCNRDHVIDISCGQKKKLKLIEIGNSALCTTFW